MSATADIQPGTILYSRWGYDQTNIDWYEVIDRTPKTIILRQIRCRRASQITDLSDTTEPIPGDYYGAPFRRKIQTAWDGVIISDYAFARTWYGTPKYSSRYA